jgi:hypothetical protein
MFHLLKQAQIEINAISVKTINYQFYFNESNFGIMVITENCKQDK